MAVIENLDVILRANTGNFDSAIDRTDKKLSSFKDKVNKHGSSLQGGMSQLFGSLGGSFGGIGSSLSGITSGLSGMVSAAGVATAGVAALAAAAGAAGVALVGLGLSQMGAIAETGRLAKELGTTTETIQALKYGLGQVGVSSEEAGGMLKELNIRLGSAELGANAHGAGEALARLHLNARQLGQLPLDEKLTAIQNGLKNVGNAAERAAIAKHLGGPELLRLLDGSAGSMSELTAKAKELGLTFSGEQAASVQKANAAWASMKAALTGVGNTMAFALAPIVERVSKLVEGFFVGVNHAIQAVGPFVDAFLTTWAAEWQMWGEMASAVGGAIGEVLSSLGVSFSGLGISWDDVKKVFLESLWTLEFSFKHWKDVGGAVIDGLGEYFAALSKNVEQVCADIGHNFDELWKLLKSGGAEGGKFVFHDLTQAWADAVNNIAQKNIALGQNLNDFIAEKWREFNKKAADSAKSSTSPDSILQKPKEQGAAEKGSLEAFKIIQAATVDKTVGAINALHNTTKEGNKALQKIISGLEKAPKLGKGTV